MLINGDDSFIIPFLPYSEISKQEAIVNINLWSLAEIQINHLYNLNKDSISNKLKGLANDLTYLKKIYPDNYNNNIEIKEVKDLLNRALDLQKENDAFKYESASIKLVSISILYKHINTKKVNRKELLGIDIFRYCLQQYMEQVDLYTIQSVCAFDGVIYKGEIKKVIISTYNSFFESSSKLNAIKQYLMRDVNIIIRIYEIIDEFVVDLDDSYIMMNEIDNAIKQIIFESTMCFSIFIIT